MSSNATCQAAGKGASATSGRRELLNSEEHGGPMVVIMLLAHEHDSDPEMRPPPMPDDKREEMLLELIAGLTRVYLGYAQSSCWSWRAALATRVERLASFDPPADLSAPRRRDARQARR